MKLDAGTRLGPYEILALIGAAGMGEVYQARDTRLDRVVAIKLCAEQFSERFEREARDVAALNHPNICTLYDVGSNYLVMEYIEGPTLAGTIPLAEALATGAERIKNVQCIAGKLKQAHTDQASEGRNGSQAQLSAASLVQRKDMNTAQSSGSMAACAGSLQQSA